MLHYSNSFQFHLFVKIWIRSDLVECSPMLAILICLKCLWILVFWQFNVIFINTDLTPFIKIRVRVYILRFVLVSSRSILISLFSISFFHISIYICASVLCVTTFEILYHSSNCLYFCSPFLIVFVLLVVLCLTHCVLSLSQQIHFDIFCCLW